MGGEFLVSVTVGRPGGGGEVKKGDGMFKNAIERETKPKIDQILYVFRTMITFQKRYASS